MLSFFRLSFVCRLSATFVHPTQPVENVMTINVEMALILRHFTEFGSFRSALRERFIDDSIDQ